MAYNLFSMLETPTSSPEASTFEKELNSLYKNTKLELNVLKEQVEGTRISYMRGIFQRI